MNTNWTGKELIRGGSNMGKTWDALHANSLEWYKDNGKGDWKRKAELEIKRRDTLTGGNYLMY